MCINFEGRHALMAYYFKRGRNGGALYTMLIRFDSTGIYIRLGSQLTNFPVGTTFKFTKALILVPPDSPGPSP